LLHQQEDDEYEEEEDVDDDDDNNEDGDVEDEVNCDECNATDELREDEKKLVSSDDCEEAALSAVTEGEHRVYVLCVHRH